MNRRASTPLHLALLLCGVLAAGACAVPGSPAPTATTIVTATSVPPTPTIAPMPTPTLAATVTPPGPRDQTPQEIYRRVGPAVVTVVNFYAQGNQRGTAYGTGIVVDRRGYIVTNNHVIEGQRQLAVIFSDGAKHDAQLVGSDRSTDLAVLKVEANPLAVATFGDSSKLEPGQTVVAIGSALGEFTNTVTTGIISGLHRQLPPQNNIRLEGLIQTDAAINPGNSGGPLLNLQGQVIGINTAVVRQSGSGSNTAEGLGFAIPANLAKAISEQIITEGRVIRASLGAETTPLTPGLAVQNDLQVQQGAFVNRVAAGGPAATAGIQPNDVIIAVDGKPVNQDNNLPLLLLSYRPGVQVTVIVARGQERLSVSVTLSEPAP